MFGNLFKRNRPLGSPLDPGLASAPAAPVGALSASRVPEPLVMPAMAPAASLGASAASSLTARLPTPPANVQRKKLNMWDKEHISSTLAELSRGFMSGGNVLQGLSAAAGNLDTRRQALLKAAQPSTEIGGPDNAFEITTDADGNRSYKRIEAVSDYLTGREKAKNAPKPKETAEFLGDSLYAIEQLEPEQRPGAYQLMVEQGTALGHDMSSASPEYSPTFSKAMIQRTIGARQGATNEATRQYRAEINADRDEARASTIAARNASQGRADAAAGRAAESHSRRMRPAPPSKRRGSKNSDLDYLR